MVKEGVQTKRENLQAEEDKDLRPNASASGGGINAESLERGQHDEQGRPSVVEREGQVDEHLVRSALGLVVLLNDIVDVLRADTQRMFRSEFSIVASLPSLRN